MRFFKSPSCARMSTKDLYNQVRLEKEEEYKLKTSNEYEYVAPEHGYDYALPSQYVPSHTIESSIQEIETIVNASEPDSDVTGSFDEQAYLQNLNQKYKKRHQMRKSSPTLQSVPEYNDRHQPQRKSPSRSYHSSQERYEERDGQHLNGIGQYNERRYSPAHVESRDPLSAERYVERALKAMEFSDNDDDDKYLRMPSPASSGIKRVPTAFSYHSEDSEVELELERSNSRYELMQHENIEYNNRKINNHKGTTRRGDESRNKPDYNKSIEGTIWRNREDDEHAVMNNDRNRRMGLSEYESHLERGTSPSRLGYHHDDEYAPRRWRNSSPREEEYGDRDYGRFVDGPRPDRTRRRSRSPYTRERHRSTSRERQFDEVDHFPEEISFASLRERNPYLNQSPRTTEVVKGKKKSRGFLGIIRDSVMGKTKTKKTKEKTHVEKRLPPPIPPPPLPLPVPPEIYSSSDAPGEYYNDRIPYQQNNGYGNRYRDAEPPACDTIDFPGVDSAPRSNYTYWRETEPPRRSRSRSPSHIYRARSRSPSPVNILPRTSPQPDRRPRSRSPVNDVHLRMHQRTRSRSPGQQGIAITRTRSNASAIPFETTRSNTPQLRFNPDPRRPVPIPDSMMKHHYNTASPHNTNNNYHHNNHYGGPIGGNKSWERRERNGWSPRNNGLGHGRYQL